jgi:hypothetical protein
MALSDLALAAMLNSGLIQYPDKRLYQAATMLEPEERPTVPVRFIEPDPAKNYIFKVRPKTEGITDKASNQILVNSKAQSLSDPKMLAALLAHEGEHAKHMGTDEQFNEGPAYQRQFDVLARLGFGNKAYMAALKKEIDARTKHDATLQTLVERDMK